MINTQLEQFRGYGRIKNISAQTAVESRFGGEVETVLAVHASTQVLSAEALNGEVRYSGRVHFLVVYENAERHVCRAEKGVEFSAKAQDGECCPAYSARAKLRAENIAVRREGASVYVSVLIGADISLYGENSFEYMTGGDLVLRREQLPVYTAHLASGTQEVGDEFDMEFTGDVLLHSETVHVSDITVETGILRIEGEVNLGVLALKGENGLASFERLVPFRIELPSDSAVAGCRAEAEVFVAGATVQAEADEEKGRCRVRVELTLTAEGCIYEETTIDAATDAFSLKNEVNLQYGSITCESAGELTETTERIAGKAALSSTVDFSDVLQAVILERAEANIMKEEGRAEGVAAATLMVLGADGSLRGIEMSLPFSVPAPKEDCSVSVMVLGMSARQKQEGEIEAEATLKLSIKTRKRAELRPVVGVEEGEPVCESDSAVSVYIPREGDGLWELSKSLKKTPEEVSESNPDIEFPIRAGQRVIVYRKKPIHA